MGDDVGTGANDGGIERDPLLPMFDQIMQPNYYQRKIYHQTQAVTTLTNDQTNLS